MSYCHECGEKVAKDDVYCPYCGISLQNAAFEDSALPESENTPAQFEATVVDIPPPPELPTPIDMPSDPITEPEVVVKDISLPAMPEDFDSGAHSVDSLLGSSATDPVAPQFSERYSGLEPQKGEDGTEIKQENAEADSAPQPFNESGFAVQSETAESAASSVKEYGSNQHGAGGVAQQDTEGSSSDMDFDRTIPYHPEVFGGQQPVRQPFEQNQSNINEKEHSPVKIEQPPESLAENEEILPATLISAQLPPFAESKAGQTESREEVSAAQTGAQPQEQANLSQSAQPERAEDSIDKEARSYTSPNVNAADTGGKKAKLQTLSEGTILNGRYEIVRKIGGGGMGAVYLASDRNLGGVLRAVKEMVQSYIEETQQEKAIQDFKRESLLLTSLEHPSIPTIFDYFYDEKEGRFYLVMKYISGGDLSARLRSSPEGRIDERSVTEWAIQVADVLDYLHNRQPPIVYRDLKPSNIMLDSNTGRVMLIDFGIARWVNKEEKGVTAVGTMGYAPPELFSGNVEPRSDIYSLGSTMFHLLTGADPQNNPLLIFDFHKNPRPRQINPQLSDQIEQILMRAVEYNADKRFTSAAEMREVLTRHLENIKNGRVTYGLGETSSGAAVETTTVFCGFCGQKIVATDLFCPFCGAKQPLAAAAAGGTAGQAPSAFVPVPKVTAKLYVINTSDLEAPVFKLEKDTNLVGRRDPLSNIFPEVDLSKFDPQTKISRRHARIWREGETFLIEDLGSSNGTILVAQSSEPVRLLPRQPRPLMHGDKLKLGDTTLHFVLG